MMLTKITSLPLALLLLIGSRASAEISMAPQGAPETLSLDEAMRQAFEHSFTRRSSHEDIEASRSRQAALKGSMGPRLSVEGSRGWIDTDVNKLAGKTLPTGQRYPDEIASVAAVVAQPITQVFAMQDRLHAEQKLEEATRDETEAQGTDAKVQGAEAYLAALRALRYLEINRESRELIQKQRNDADRLRSQGTLSTLDFSRFELAVSDAESLVLDAEARLRVAEDALRETLGWDKSRPLQLQDVSSATAELPGTTEERKELLAASRRIEALEENKKAMNKDFWPQLNAFARMGRDFAAEDVNVNFLGLAYAAPKEDFRDQLSYGFNMQWDIWDWNVRANRQAEISSQVAKARVQQEALASRITMERSEADAEWIRASQNYKNAQIADRLSAEILRSFDTKFRNGLATTTDLLTVQRDRTRAQAQLSNAGCDMQLAILHKKRADGLPL